MGEEFRTLLDDIDAMAYLGRYYAKKIHGAVALAFYEETGARKHQREAVAHLRAALEHWKSYASVSIANYRPQMLARTNRLDWTALTAEAERDIEIAGGR
jgi:hypothetical protein